MLTVGFFCPFLNDCEPDAPSKMDNCTGLVASPALRDLSDPALAWPMVYLDLGLRPPTAAFLVRYKSPQDTQMLMVLCPEGKEILWVHPP